MMHPMHQVDDPALALAQMGELFAERSMALMEKDPHRGCLRCASLRQYCGYNTSGMPEVTQLRSTTRCVEALPKSLSISHCSWAPRAMKKALKRLECYRRRLSSLACKSSSSPPPPPMAWATRPSATAFFCRSDGVSPSYRSSSKPKPCAEWRDTY